MRVFQVTNDFPPLIGGMAAHAWELSKALAQLGHDVEVLTGSRVKHSRTRFATTQVRRSEGVTVHQIGFPLIFRRYQRRWIRYAVERYLTKASTTRAPGVIHLHEHLRPLEFDRRAELWPLVWTNHSSMFLRDFEDPQRHGVLREVIDRCDWITAPSYELLKKTSSLSQHPERVAYIPNGVDIDRFRPCEARRERVLITDRGRVQLSRDDVVVLCARRFVPKNGVHLFVDALEKVLPWLTRVPVTVFAGNSRGQPSEYECRLLERIRQLSRCWPCYLLGEVPNEEMPSLYGVTDVAVLPSLQEATSITGLEAMASALPIVGSDAGGIPEIVEHGRSGLLFRRGDADSLAEALGRLIRDRAMREHMGSEGRRRAEVDFSWGRVAVRFVEGYNSTMDRKRLVWRTARR